MKYNQSVNLKCGIKHCKTIDAVKINGRYVDPSAFKARIRAKLIAGLVLLSSAIGALFAFWPAF